MAYLPNFAHDIFISYAHVDNQASPGEVEGWISSFQKYLAIYLSRRVGKMDAVKIWRDPTLDGSQLFDKTIKEKIEGSAIFIALTSTGYLESTYCRQELEWFYEKAEREPGGVSIGDRMRVLNVLLNNIPFAQWPRQYGKTSGYAFYSSEGEDDLGFPLKPTAELFDARLRKLVESIYKTMTATKDTIAPTPSPKPFTKTIFLADTSDSLSFSRKRLLNDLQAESGVRIVSNIPPPYDAESHEQKVVEVMRQADLTVHLLDHLPGREIQDQGGKSYPQSQVEMGLKHAKSQFVWVPQTLDVETIEDENYKTFIDQLQNGNRGAASYSFVRGSASSITRELLEMLHRAPDPNLNERAAPTAALVDTHLRDQLHAYRVGQFLIGKSIQPYINPEEDDPQKNMKILEERLKQVNKLIVIFGDVAEDWVRARLGVALQIAVTERCPLKACGVYFAPPRQRGAESIFNLPFLPVHEFDNSDITNPQFLDSMLNTA